MKFKTFYTNLPKPVGTVLDTETKFVDQSEADRASLSYQLERFGMDSLLQKLEQTKAQFGYADTRLTKNFEDYANSMAEANSYFSQLPAKIRKEFNHNPIEFYSRIEREPEYMYKQGFISERLAKDLGVITLQDSNIANESVQAVEPVNNVSNTENVSA